MENDDESDDDDSDNGNEIIELDNLKTYKRGKAQITASSAVSFITMYFI